MGAVKSLFSRLAKLKASGLTGLNLIATMVKRKISPLMARPTSIGTYTGLRDPSRLGSLVWEEDALITKMKRLTTRRVTGWEMGGLEAHTAKKPAPAVSPIAIWLLDLPFVVSF